MNISRRRFIKGASLALSSPALLLAPRPAAAMQLVGLAQRFEYEKFWAGPCEADFLHGTDNLLKVIHQAPGGGPYGNDVAQTTASAGSPGSGLLSRAPQATVLRYPYAFTGRRGNDLLTGVRDNTHGHSWLYQRGGGSDATWYEQNGANPILYQAGSGPWSQIYNNPMIDLPGGYWLCMPEIGGGMGSALGTSFSNIEAGKSSGLVIPEGGNGALQVYRDTHVILWLGLRDNNFYYGTNFWFTTVATAPIAAIIAAPGNPANWTVHKERFAIGYKGKHVCDPAPYDGADGARLMVSYDQAGMMFLRSSRGLTDLYAELIS